MALEDALSGASHLADAEVADQQQSYVVHSDAEGPSGEQPLKLCLEAAHITKDQNGPLRTGGKRSADNMLSEAHRQAQRPKQEGHRSNSRAQMHPANLHHAQLDFQALAKEYPALEPYLLRSPMQRCNFDFTSPAAARCAAS